MDVSAAVQAVTGVLAAVGAVGGAKLGVETAIQSFKHLREVLGEPAYQEFMDSPGSEAGARQDAKDDAAAAPGGHWHTLSVNGVERSVWIEDEADDELDSFDRYAAYEAGAPMPTLSGGSVDEAELRFGRSLDEWNNREG